MAEQQHFHWADYLVFAIVLFLSCACSLWVVSRRRKRTEESLLVADREMSVLPVAMSIFVSYLSAVSFLADPVEVYQYGASYWFSAVGYCLVLPVVAHFFVPGFHKLDLISINKFLENRFNNILRYLGVFFSIVLMMVFLGVVLYAPSLALSQVTGVQLWLVIIIVGLVCTVYTSLGGMKGVLLADTFQLVVMVAGLILIISLAAAEIGGIGEVWSRAKEGGRLTLIVDPEPTLNASVWTYSIGAFFRLFSSLISVQLFSQRYSSLPTAKKAMIAVYCNAPIHILVTSLFALTGLVMYAYYYNCDPTVNADIMAMDQMLPLMVMDTLGKYPGIPGLFLASVFSASLSTMSSAQNGIAAVILKDLVQPIARKTKNKVPSERASSIIITVTSVLMGFVNIGLAFAVMQFNRTVFYTTVTLIGVFGSPLAGVYVLGMLCPFVDAYSALTGYIISAGFSMWIGLTGFFTGYHVTFNRLEVSVAGCDMGNITMPLNTTMPSRPHMDNTGYVNLYRLSPLYYAPIGLLLTVVIGMFVAGIVHLVQYITNPSNRSRSRNDESSMVDFKMSRESDFTNC